MRACRRTDLQRNPGARLGAVLAQLAHEDRRTLFLEVDPRLAGFDDWIAQLVAESTGKQGKGLVPAPGEGATAPGVAAGSTSCASAAACRRCRRINPTTAASEMPCWTG